MFLEFKDDGPGFVLKCLQCGEPARKEVAVVKLSSHAHPQRFAGAQFQYKIPVTKK
jgi:hypothetical protein